MVLTSVLPVIAFIAITAIVAAFGSAFQPGDWYAQLTKPDWTPPNWLFGPVWSLLYLMIAISGWLVWRAQGFGTLLSVWCVQLALNAAWSWIMFGRHQIGMAFFDIVVLVSVSVFYAIAAWPVSKTAAFLFVPYCGWLGYAAALNIALWRLNS